MADDLIHLVEYGKGHEDPVQGGLIMQFGGYSDIIESLPFKSVSQGRNVFSRETSQPAVAFRGINEEPDISHGQEEELQDQCYPISGLLEFDRVKLRRYGERKRQTYMMQQMENAAALWTTTLIDGNNATDPKEFSGLKTQLVATNGGAATSDVDGSNDDSRLLANSTASGGGAPSFGMLDKAMELVNNPNQIWMSRDLKTKLMAAARDPNLTNNRVTSDMDSQLGRRVDRYGEAIIMTGYPPSKRSKLLPYDEVGYGGGAAVTTSIYVCSVREDGVCGIQTAPPEVLDIGHTDRGVHERDLYEWDAGYTQEDFYAALRMSSITNAAWVA